MDFCQYTAERFAKGYGLHICYEQAVIDVFKDIDEQERFVETVALNAADMGFGNDRKWNAYTHWRYIRF